MTAPVAWIVPGRERLTNVTRYVTTADGTRWVYATSTVFADGWHALADITITNGDQP